MKKIIIFLGIISSIFSSCRTSNWELPNEYVGNWATAKQPVIVRTYAFGDGFSFIKDSAVVTLNINKNKTVSGTIGNAEFKNAVIIRNKPNTDLSGIAYIVQCGDIGQIFPNDPLLKKEVEIWLMPVNSGKLEAELRYTEGWAVFPMAGLKLVK